MCDLADDRDVKIGALDYHFHWSGTHATPPGYTLTITRNLSGSQPSPVMTLTVTGVKVHCFTENRDYRKCIVDALVSQFKASPPDETHSVCV